MAMKVIGGLMTAAGGIGAVVSQIVRLYYKNASPYSWATSTPYAVKQRAQEFEKIAENAELFFNGFIVVLIIGVVFLFLGVMQAKNRTAPYSLPKTQPIGTAPLGTAQCPVCKNVVVPNSRFCGKCGTALQWPAQNEMNNMNKQS